MNISMCLHALDIHQEPEIFDPFKLDDCDNHNNIEYQGEPDSDKSTSLH